MDCVGDIMAEMAKKIHFLKNGTEQTAKAYSTTAETGGSYITNSIDNTTVYVPIVGTSDSRATIGRVLKNGTTYAISTTGKPAYAEKSWTTAGSYTFTVPQGVTRVRVAVCGGGGGGTDNNMSKKAGDGGSSSFGSLISATGGGGGKNKGGYDHGTEDWSNGEPQGGTAGSPNGYTGTTNNTNTAGFSLSFSKTSGGYGYGGKGDGDGGGGGSGGYNSNYVNVISGSTYSVVVGKGGSRLGGNRTANGASGFVLIAYGGSI